MQTLGEYSLNVRHHFASAREREPFRSRDFQGELMASPVDR